MQPPDGLPGRGQGSALLDFLQKRPVHHHHLGDTQPAAAQHCADGKHPHSGRNRVLIELQSTTSRSRLSKSMRMPPDDSSATSSAGFRLHFRPRAAHPFDRRTLFRTLKRHATGMWPLQLDPSAPIRRPSSNFFFVVPFRRQLSLVIDNLPTLSGQFQCAFSALGKVLLTNATRTANGVICTTPRTDHIPANPPGQRKWLLFRIFSSFPVGF